MMLMLPTWPVKESVEHFTSKGHWAISNTLTTNHMLAIVALTNTLMSMNSAAFTDGKILRQTIPRFLNTNDVIQHNYCPCFIAIYFFVTQGCLQGWRRS